MAQLMQVRLSRYDAQPWGFRLQGGADYGTPLMVQKVNAGSLAEQAGLIPGDIVCKINDVDCFSLRHKDAQDLVVKSGNTFNIIIERGQATWRPHVTPTGSLPSPHGGHIGHNIPTVTKTSLAHRRPQEEEHIGCGYNNSARPFNAANGHGAPVKSIVNKQYNTPVGIYSDEAIAETLSAQAEVLAEGVLGVNFKKNEKQYNAEKSEVLKFLREAENEPSESAYNNHHHDNHSHHDNHAPQQHNSPYQNTGPIKHVIAPVDTPKPQGTGGHSYGGQNICSECDRLIVGVFVRIKDKNLHAECFKCATCGTSLKNQGYYNFNNKLYCDIHAKLAAQQNPPPGTEGYVPVPIRPGMKLNANTVSNALNSHGYQGVPNSAAGQPKVNNQPFSRPYGQAPRSPIAASQKSPTSYPPPSQGGNWGQQQQQHQQARPQQNPYATLPRTNFGSSPQGRSSYNTSTPQHFNNRPGSYYNNSHSPNYNQNTTANYNSYNKGAGVGAGAGGNRGSGVYGATSAPKRGRGVWNQAVSSGYRTPNCNSCGIQIRGPFITALGRIWCPEHFICVNASCRRPLQDIGFVEEKGDLYCEYCFEQYLAPTCSKCHGKIKGDCLNAIGKHFHPECFTCFYCGKLFGNTPFFLEDGQPYCEADWNELFTTKCFACGFPVEAGDRWVEALSHNYHSQCFNCTMCKANLEGQSFYNKGGRPFCKNHAR